MVGLEIGENGELLFKGVEFQFQEMKRVLEMVVVMVAQPCEWVSYQ